TSGGSTARRYRHRPSRPSPGWTRPQPGRCNDAAMAGRLRVGIVGVGWGALVHGPAYQLVDDYELVALCGRRPEPLAAASERLGITDTANDWQAFVKRDDLDVVSI